VSPKLGQKSPEPAADVDVLADMAVRWQGVGQLTPEPVDRGRPGTTQHRPASIYRAGPLLIAASIWLR